MSGSGMGIYYLTLLEGLYESSVLILALPRCNVQASYASTSSRSAARLATRFDILSESLIHTQLDPQDSITWLRLVGQISRRPMRMNSKRKIRNP